MINYSYTTSRTLRGRPGQPNRVMTWAYHSREMIHDYTRRSQLKRTNAWSHTVDHYEAGYRTLKDGSEWGFDGYYFSRGVMQCPEREINAIMAKMITDWDTGLDRVIGEKITAFSYAAQAFEITELKTIARSFVSRSINFFYNVYKTGASIVLLNNLVVVPTLSALFQVFNEKTSSYERALRAIKKLQRPTKFSCQPIYRTKRIVRENIPLYWDRYGSAVYGDIVHSIKVVKRSTGVLAGDPFINRILLSYMTSGIQMDLGDVWDRVPFTFLIDYFFNIGEVLSVDTKDYCKFIPSACCSTFKVTITSTFKNVRVVGGDIVNVQAPFMRESYFIRERDMAVFDGKDAEINHEADLSISQWLNFLLVAIAMPAEGLLKGGN